MTDKYQVWPVSEFVIWASRVDLFICSLHLYLFVYLFFLLLLLRYEQAVSGFDIWASNVHLFGGEKAGSPASLPFSFD